MEIIYNDVAEYFCEWKYLQEVIKHLEPNLSDKYVLHVACLSVECENYKNVKFVKGKKNIIIGTSDEYMKDIHAPYIENSIAIFKQYLLPGQETGNVYSFPLGYNKKHISLENKPLAQRSIDAFFSGHMSSANRHSSMTPVISYFKNLPKQQRPKLEINVSSGFNRGLAGPLYSEKLHNSKIAICPHGNASVETFRFYEAMRSGCVVVTPLLPATEIYKNSNVIQVKNWHENAGPVIMDLLKDQNKLTEIKDSIQENWNSTLCARAAARRILDKLHLPTNK
tara:strand:+ start:5190 stop:6032 length:843 start_codon:yes stop_codon:yes gene_type:complete